MGRVRGVPSLIVGLSLQTESGDFTHLKLNFFGNMLQILGESVRVSRISYLLWLVVL